MISETNITCFLYVCETMSFTESARRLYLTQQAVSKNVMQLEHDTGINLIDRTSKTVALTEDGERYRDLLKRIIGIYESETSLIKMFSTTNIKLDIGCQNFIDMGTGLLNTVRSLKAGHNDLNVSVNRFSPGDLVERLYKGETNAVMLYKRYAPNNPDYASIDLFKSHICLLVCKDHPAVNDNSSFQDFRHEPFVMDVFTNETEQAAKQRAKREIRLLQIEPSEIILTPNRESAYNVAAMNNGILIGTELSQIPPGYNIVRYTTDATDSISCICKPNASPLMTEFVETLKKSYIK